MTSFRFLHAADIHLDSPLKGLAGQQDSTAVRIRSATREALDQLVGFALEETVDFLVIAGDLYDGDWKDFRTGLFFAGQMGRLNAAGIPAYLLHGNHDAESRITRQLTLPDNVHVFSSRKPQTYELKRIHAVLHGQSFPDRDVSGNLVPTYPEPVSNAFNIGVLHTGLGGMGGHANYAPCSLPELTNKGYEYWALGHVHQQSVLHEHPHVVFPGNLQGRHIRETGPKGAILVTVEDHTVTDLRPVPCDHVRWTVIKVVLEADDDMDQAIRRIRNSLEAALDTEADGRLLACRFIIEGFSNLHNRLAVSQEQLLNEVRSVALGAGNEAAWVEKVIVATRPPLRSEEIPQREDAIGDLLRLLERAASDEALLDQIGNDIDPLVNNLPAELRQQVEDPLMQSMLAGDRAGLIRQVVPQLSAMLMEEKG